MDWPGARAAGMRIETVLTPSALGVRAWDAGGVCVVFDVLRATTVFVTALGCGVQRVIPAATIAEARALREARPGALLGGERGGSQIPGFDLGNSPAEYQGLAGREIVSTTTNGTVALRACAGEVVAACFLNLAATAAALARRRPALVVMVCAGTGPEFAIEDGLAAGALASLLGPCECCDATLAMRELAASPRLFDLARQSRNAVALARAGREADIAWALRRDVYDVVVCRRGEALEAEAKP